MYGVVFLLGLAFIIIPIIGEKCNSTETSVFLLTLGYSGLSFNKRKNDTRLTLPSKEYLKISKRNQCIFGLVLLIATSVMYFANVNQFLFAVMVLPIGLVGSALLWKEMKKYKI